MALTIPDEYKDRVILVVEDTNMMRVLMTRYLSQAGFRNVLECVNGQEALDLLRSQKVDLVLLDIQMPVLDGYETLEAVKKDESLCEIPVIMITAVEKIESIAKCIEIGAVDYMPKLFNPILLNRRILSCLENQHLKRQLKELTATSK
jgi:DNA-binding response OmpR family regulator